MNYEICVIGNEALLFPFLQFGFTTFTPRSEKALREYLQEVINKNYGIVYIEDAYCFKVKDILDKYKGEICPVFVPIGDNADGPGYSRLMVKEMMEKAVGQNIL